MNYPPTSWLYVAREEADFYGCDLEPEIIIACGLLDLVEAGARFALTENALLISPHEGRTYMQLLPDDQKKANFYIDVIYPALI